MKHTEESSRKAFIASFPEDHDPLEPLLQRIRIETKNSELYFNYQNLNQILAPLPGKERHDFLDLTIFFLSVAGTENRIQKQSSRNYILQPCASALEGRALGPTPLPQIRGNCSGLLIYFSAGCSAVQNSIFCCVITSL